MSYNQADSEPALTVPKVLAHSQPTIGVEATAPGMIHEFQVDEIISSQLPFVVKWGTLIFFFLLTLLAAVCGFIKYPDIVTADGTLNSINAPRKVTTKSEGKLMNIAVTENDFVTAGQVLGYMESTANPQAVLSVNKQVETISRLVNDDHVSEIQRFQPVQAKQPAANLGELQPAYQTFAGAFVQFKEVLSNGFLQRKKLMLLTDLHNVERMNVSLLEQRSLLLQDLDLSSKTFEANKTLLDSKVIALVDYRLEKSKFLAKQLTLPQMNASIIANEEQLNAKKEEIFELDNQMSARKYAFNQELKTMKSQIQAWESKYLLKAPVSGVVAFASFFQENQEMTIGQSLFYIHPQNSSYFVEITVPQYNFGKVRVGQQVALKFPAYSSEQYGAVLGTIEYISSSPTKAGYLAKVALPNRLRTTRNKTLRFQQGLVVTADIITEDMNLLRRFYYDMFKQFRM